MYQLKDITDSRDINARLTELQEERDILVMEMADDGKVAENNLESWDDENKEELDALIELCDDCSEKNVDWDSGTCIIHDDYFTQYAKDLASDINGFGHVWPCDHIDWDAAADALKDDYSEVEYEGDTYFVRST